MAKKKNKSISLEEFIVLNIAAFPSIFYDRKDVLHHMYCVIGCGFKWKNGRLIDGDYYEVNKQRILEEYRNGSLNLEHEIHRSLRLYDDKVAAQQARIRGLLGKTRDKRKMRDLLENRKESSILTRRIVYPYSILANVANIPDDVRPDFLQGAIEILEFILTLDPSAGSLTRSNKEFWLKAIDIRDDIKKRFGV